MADPNPMSKDGKTPMHLAALNGHADICSLIADHTSNPNQGDMFGNTPLHEAARRGHTEVYQEIMDLVEDKNPARSDSGITPLHLSAENGHYALTRLILEQTKDHCPRDRVGNNTPMELAAKKGHLEICILFKKRPNRLCSPPQGKNIWFFLPGQSGRQTFFSCTTYSTPIKQRAPQEYGALNFA